MLSNMSETSMQNIVRDVQPKLAVKLIPLDASECNQDCKLISHNQTSEKLVEMFVTEFAVMLVCHYRGLCVQECGHCVPSFR